MENGPLETIPYNVKGKIQEQYIRFEKLIETATLEELTELTNYPSGVVRGYAFVALVETKAGDNLSIILNHLNDYEEIKIIGGGKEKTSKVWRLYDRNWKAYRGSRRNIVYGVN